MQSVSQAVVLGAVQGLAEWLPISSEGMNTLILMNFFGVGAGEAIPMSIWLHLGTMLAAIVYFRKDLLGILRDKVLLRFLVIATLLTGVVGYPIFRFATTFSGYTGSQATAVIGLLLLATGWLQRRAALYSHKREKDLGDKDTIVTGSAQGFAVLPGLSRSGLTVSALLLLGFNAEEALRLSFIMSIPAVLLAEIGMFATGTAPQFTYISLVGLASSFFFGLISIRAFMELARKARFWRFCIFLGFLSFLPFLLGI